jgi:hypothetical protein
VHYIVFIFKWDGSIFQSPISHSPLRQIHSLDIYMYVCMYVYIFKIILINSFYLEKKSAGSVAPVVEHLPRGLELKP